MPVLDLCGNVHTVAGIHLYRILAPLLIETVAADTDQNLSAALIRVMHMPEVAAAGLEGHVVDSDLTGGYRSQIALSGEPFRESVVGSSDGEEAALLISLFADGGLVLAPDLHGQTEDCPALGPAGVHGRMCDDRRNLFFADAVVLGILQMILQRTVRNP